MNTATHLGGGRYRHRESLPFTASEPRARHLDTAAVRRVIDREVGKALRPLTTQLEKMRRDLDAVGVQNADTEAKLAPFAPLVAARDAMKRDKRRPTPAEVNSANRARYGRDAEGRNPGELGFGLSGAAVRDAAADAPSPAAAINAMNRKLWGRS